MKVIDLHVIGTTGCQRKLSDKTSVLSQHHIESILDMVQYESLYFPSPFPCFSFFNLFFLLFFQKNQ